MAGEIEARLKALDLTLPEVALPVADYVSFLHLNGQLFVVARSQTETMPVKYGSRMNTQLHANRASLRGENSIVP